MTWIYLACPYAHLDAAVRQTRFELATRKAAELFAAGYRVFSPITHSHPLHEAMPEALPCDWQFWRAFDEVMLGIADEVHVLCLAGWQESVGVQSEIALCKKLGKPVIFHGPGGGDA